MRMAGKEASSTRKPVRSESLSEVNSTIETNVRGSFWRRILSFLGPAWLVSVGYMDPGNWATDLAGGSRFGYSLLWVLVMSNLIALLLQSLSARMGVVARRDLAQASRELYPKPVNYALYFLAEIAIAACDLAEVVGMAIGLQLLFGIPLIWGVAMSILDAFLLLLLMQWGLRKLEVFILGLIAIIGGAFLVQMILSKPVGGELITGFLPTIPNDEALFIAIGIIGATVMPHNLYLHSALVQSRKILRTEGGLRQAIRFNIFDSALALNAALFVNAAILILAAAVFHKNGYTGVSEIQDAHRLLEPLLGKNYAPVLFAVALIAAGQSSTITGTLAGQIVMEGHLHLRIAPWLRRLITRSLAVVPALLTIVFAGESATGHLLVLSQVILSMQLGFAVVPLLHFVSDKRRMGQFAIGPWTKAGGWLAALIIVSLNIKLVVGQVFEWLEASGEHRWAIQFLVIPALLLAASTFVFITLKPLLTKPAERSTGIPHGVFNAFQIGPSAAYRNIGVAIDFSDVDEKTLRHALHLGGEKARYFLIHAVESASALAIGADAADLESDEDRKNLEAYAELFRQKGIDCQAIIGYGSPKKVLPEWVVKKSMDVLVMGAHGHRSFMDLILGETVGAVRHAVRIPVLVVK